MAYLDRIDRYRHEIVAALSREFCAFKMARSTKRAFRRHSSHSSSTTESATMPEPTPKTADPSLADVSGVSRRVLIATLNRERQPPLPPSSCPRSEEHTSELQSLMRISYAVFCLKKK